MKSVFLHELKYYFRNVSELTKLYGLFISILLVFLFALPAGAAASAITVSAIFWAALTVVVSLGGSGLFQRDHEGGQLAYYQLQPVPLWRIICAKWMAYYACITMLLALSFPVMALLVDIPVEAWPRYGIGLGSGAMALSLLTTLVACVMAGQEKVGALLQMVTLPLTIPITIFGVSHLAQVGAIITPSLLFLWGFSLIILPITCMVGSASIRASN